MSCVISHDGIFSRDNGRVIHDMNNHLIAGIKGAEPFTEGGDCTRGVEASLRRGVYLQLRPTRLGRHHYEANHHGGHEREHVRQGAQDEV